MHHPSPGPWESLTRPLHELPDPLPVPCLTLDRGRPPLLARVRTPGSKSLTNRALLLAALARGRSLIHRPLLGAEDTECMVRALGVLGARVRVDGDVLSVDGVAGRWLPKGDECRLDLENAGTAVRFLSAAAALSPVPVVIDGNERMRKRPLGELVDALAELGVRGEYLGSTGCPPVRLSPPATPPRGVTIELGPTMSSQFISALLLAAPWRPGGLTLKLDGEITSRSYIQMTIGLLDLLGVPVRSSDNLRIVRVATAEGDGCPAFEYSVEPDASSATYFWGAAAVFPGAICRVEGLDARSLQGDAGFPEILARMGATVIREDDSPPSVGVRGPTTLAPIMADMSDMPDAAITLAVVASFATGRSIIRGLHTLRVKESDRIAGLQTELGKVGVKVETNVLGDAGAMTISAPLGGIDCSAACPRVEFDTYDDHRMAMGLALIGLRRPNTFIRNPGCVAKTYPGYWGALASLA